MNINILFSRTVFGYFNVRYISYSVIKIQALTFNSELEASISAAAAQWSMLDLRLREGRYCRNPEMSRYKLGSGTEV